MGSGLSLGDLIPAAVGIALSPLPVAAVILMLFSSRARVNGPIFVVGWIMGLVVVGAAALIFGGGSAGSTNEPSALSLWVKLVLGVLLLLAGLKQWRSRSGPEDSPSMPAWMESIDGFTPGKAFGVAALLSGVNPKNLALNVAGVVVIAQAGLKPSGEWMWFAVFVVLASLTVVVPVAYYLIAGKRADAALKRMKTWLIQNNAAVMGVLLLVFGLKLVSEGAQGLLM